MSNRHQRYLKFRFGKSIGSDAGAIPELTSLALLPNDTMMAVLPNLFLGGSAPRLRFLTLRGIPFPGLPKLLLSATHLTNLHLICVPHSGYFPPEAMVTVLSRLTSLESLDLAFQSPPSLPDRATRRPPPPKRFVLPVLTYFGFKGVGEYLDGLVVRIDAPLLERLDITFFNQILFDTPQLIQFITRTSALMTPETARVYFGGVAAMVSFLLQAVDYPYLTGLNFEILCETSDWQISCLEQVCTWCSPPFFALEDLYISESHYSRPYRQDNIENTLWLQLLQLFATVKNLCLYKEFGPRIMPSLQELVGERTTEVLPNLQNIFLEGLETSGPVQEGIQQFVVRRRASHPIAVSHWDRRN